MRAISAPVRTSTRVSSVVRTGRGYLVQTDRGDDWHADTVVLASGACAIASVPAMAAHLPPGIHSLAPTAYRNPDQLENAGVLVVGASATGIQLAEEIQRSSRPASIARSKRRAGLLIPFR